MFDTIQLNGILIACVEYARICESNCDTGSARRYWLLAAKVAPLAGSPLLAAAYQAWADVCKD